MTGVDVPLHCHQPLLSFMCGSACIIVLPTLFPWTCCCVSDLPEVNRKTVTKKDCHLTAWQSVGLSQLNRKPANMFGLTRLTFALKLNSNPCLVPLALPYSLFASDVFPWVVWCLFLWGMFYWSVQRGLSAGWIYSVKLRSVYNPWGTSFEAFGINCSVLPGIWPNGRHVCH